MNDEQADDANDTNCSGAIVLWHPPKQVWVEQPPLMEDITLLQQKNAAAQGGQ